jgi:hypothetical protein
MDEVRADEGSGARRGRRSVLMGVAAAVAAMITGGRMPLARAEDGAPVLLGRRNQASRTTSVTNTTRGGTAVRARARGAGGVGVDAVSDRGTGVHGLSTHGNGVSGETVFGTAVAGLAIEPGSYAVSGNSSNGVGVQGGSDGGVGVQGNCRSGIAVQGGNVSNVSPAVQGWAQNGQTGVMGLSSPLDAVEEVRSPRHVGVFGVCDAAKGRGVLARSRNGIALETRGRVKFATAGSTLVPAGATSASAMPAFMLTQAMKVIAMPQGDPGAGVSVRWVEIDRAANTIAIHLSGPVASDTTVAWFAFE